jgi:hypothetical protein
VAKVPLAEPPRQPRSQVAAGPRPRHLKLIKLTESQVCWRMG